MDDLRIISVDDHVIEAPDVWTSRLPKRYHDDCLRYVVEGGVPAWLFEDVRTVPFRGDTNGAVWPLSERRPVWEPPLYDSLPPAATDPLARLASMDEDGVEAAILFPNNPRFCGQLFSEAKDKELGLLSIKAYNDWVFEEWAAAAPDRLIPLAMIPLWDPLLAAAELERMAARGAKGFTFSQGPHALGLPSIHDPQRFWDPVFSFANDAGLVVAMHLGSNSTTPTTSPDAPQGVGMALFQLQGQETCLDWLYSRLFDRFPRLQICLSECGVGWVPAVLGLTDWSYQMSRQGRTQPGQIENETVEGARPGNRQTQIMAMLMEAGQKQRMSERNPRDVFRDHIFVCLIEEVHTVAFFEEIGLDNILIETDFPHTASRWPNSLEFVRRATPGMRDADRARICNGNARRLFGLGEDGERAKKDWLSHRPEPIETPASGIVALAASVGITEDELQQAMAKSSGGMRQKPQS
jgi:predicted TIM-barrel fold metal-dependent hydrolase